MQNPAFFDPSTCRNESEVESKFVVHYLFPALGYTPNTWNQEVVLGNIRLDFLVFAQQILPFKISSDSPLALIVEAKSPKQNLNAHISKITRYIQSLKATYGLLTNGRDFRILGRESGNIAEIFRCEGREVPDRLPEIKKLIGREEIATSRIIYTPDPHPGETPKDPLCKKENDAYNPTVLSLDVSTPSANREIPSVELFTPQPIVAETAKDPLYKEENDSYNLNVPDSKDSIPLKKTELPAVKVPEPQSIVSEIVDVPSLSNPEVNEEKNMRIIAVYHNKGGVGKTTTVINLGAALARRGFKVLLIDLDSQANTTFAAGLMKFIFEEEDDIKDRNVYHVLSKRTEFFIPDVCRRASYSLHRVDVLPAHIELVAQEKILQDVGAIKVRLLEKLNKVDDKYDFVFIDCPPSLGLYAQIGLTTADYLIIPSDLKPFANQGLGNVINFIDEINEFKTVIQRPPISVLGILPSKIMTNLKYIENTLPDLEEKVKRKYGIPLFESRIFERVDLAKCVNNEVVQGDRIIPDPKSIFDFSSDSMAAQEFQTLSEELLVKVAI